MSPAGQAFVRPFGVLGISIQSQIATGTMATGTIPGGLAFAVVATMAAAMAHAEGGRRSSRSGIAARARVSVCRQRRLMARSGHCRI
jgi:hypothetical protein